MKKKDLIVILVLLSGVGLGAIGVSNCLMGDTSHVRLDSGTSAIYSKAEIQSAMDVVKHDFRWSWGGCTLTDLFYEEDEESDDCYRSWATQYHGEDAILLYSNFEVDGSGGPYQTLNPNYTYTYWMWILVRDNDRGKWRIVGGGNG